MRIDSKISFFIKFNKNVIFVEKKSNSFDLKNRFNNFLPQKKRKPFGIG